MNICVISEGYPTKDVPIYTFVEQLCNTLALQKHNVSVVALRWLTDVFFRGRKIPYYRKCEVGENVIEVFSPLVTTFGNGKFQQFMFEKLCTVKVCNALERLPHKPDIIYGHFWHNAYLAYPFAKKHNIPLFVASGESKIIFTANTQKKKDFANYVSGVICVSSKNKNESIEKGLTSSDKCTVIPNAIDNSIFRIKDKIECRKKLGISEKDFVVSFVGRFCNRKGPERISEALKILNDDSVKCIFIGTSSDGEYIKKMNYKGIIYIGEMPNKKIPDYLNAADVFVLPTLHEGCCNAIIEAMACGLPIISSNRDFNYDVLDETNSILIDPLNINEIAEEIKKLKDNASLRLKMAESSMHKALGLNIEDRARKIVSFMEKKLN